MYVCAYSGRKTNCIVYGVLYGLACVTKVRCWCWYCSFGWFCL